MTDAVVARARGGDEDAFRTLVEPYRRELHLHCYRLLGSVTDADDVLQEVWLAAWRGLGEYRGDASPRTWLYRIATNRALNAVRDRSRRPPPVPVPPFRPPEPSRLSEVTWLQPYPDEWLPDPTPGPEARYGVRESVRLAFVAGLARLPPRQTAVLVLRDVLGYSSAETADILGVSATVVKGALQRARAALARSGADEVTDADAPDRAALAGRFADALVAGDLTALLRLLSDDAWLAMPPAPHEYCGREAVLAFLRSSQAWRGSRPAGTVPVRANGQAAFGLYLGEPGSVRGRPAGIVVLTVGGGRVRGVTRFLDDRLFALFGLASELPLDAGRPGHRPM